MDELYAQKIASNIEDYLRKNNLYYGLEPNKNGDSSWSIGVDNFLLNSEQENFIAVKLPSLIKAFHDGVRVLLEGALLSSIDNNVFKKIRTFITTGVPDETLILWKRFLEQNSQKVFSTRPDIILDKEKKFHIIEYNTDGGADKGNTLGVNLYSEKFLNKKSLGANLVESFLKEILREYGEKEKIIIATVLPDTYRREYVSQNMYFSNMANANPLFTNKIKWISVFLSDISINEKTVSVHIDGEEITIDIIDREFKLPGFDKNINFCREILLLEAVLEKKVFLLGSILPFQDKIFLSTIFDDAYSFAFPKDLLLDMRSIHAETDIIEMSKQNIKLGYEVYRFDDIYNLNLDIDFVLKRAGDNAGSTGSKGVVISKDVSLMVWRESLDLARNEPGLGGNYWVIQKFYSSDCFKVEYIRNSRSKPKNVSAINRIAPYYVKDNNSYQLGNVLVTAGTDEEVQKKKKNNIHGLRQNTYQAVSLN